MRKKLCLKPTWIQLVARLLQLEDCAFYLHFAPFRLVSLTGAWNLVSSHGYVSLFREVMTMSAR